jgi:hypothetical protein
MAATLLLDQSTWDLCLDASGNIAVATSPYAEAQDAASAIKTFLGECYFDTTVGVPYLQQIFGKSLPLALLKQQLIEAALTVPGVVSAQVFISGISGRTVSGQVQVTLSSGQSSMASFNAVNPQGAG